MSPASANVKNERLVRQNLFHQHRKKTKWRHRSAGENSKRKHAFENDYLPGWSEEILIISKKFPITPVTYAVNDLAYEEIK